MGHLSTIFKGSIYLLKVKVTEEQNRSEQKESGIYHPLHSLSKWQYLPKPSLVEARSLELHPCILYGCEVLNFGAIFFCHSKCNIREMDQKGRSQDSQGIPAAQTLV